MVTINKAVAKKWLDNVDSEKYFWCSDGRVLKSLPELAVALKEMSDETFCYHSNEIKSDFSNWVQDVVGDEKLARDLQKSTTQI